MSVQRISDLESREPDAREQPAYEGPKPGAINNESLDRHISSAIEKHGLGNEEPARTGKSLDQLITEGQERAAAKEQDEESWKASKADREEMNSRYAKYDASTAKTLERFIQWAGALKASPQQAAQAAAESYLAIPFSETTEQTKKELPEVYVDPYGKRYTGQRLDAIIQDSIETAGREGADYEATAKHRAALKAILPDKSFSEAIAYIKTIDTEMRKDPLMTAAKVGASMGMPVLPHQYEAKAQLDGAHTLIQQATPHLPGLQNQQVRNNVAEIISRRDFVSSGNPQVDLQRGYQIAAHLQQQSNQTQGWAEASLANIAKTDPALAKAVEHTLLKDPTYRQQADAIVRSYPLGDPRVPEVNMALAVGIATERQKNLAKAQKARPVKSTGGVSSKQSGGDAMDRAISAAMSNFRD